MKTVCLNGMWRIVGKKQGGAPETEISFSGKVPGCVQLDLSENGFLPKDLFMGENIRQAEAYENMNAPFAPRRNGNGSFWCLRG